MEVGNADNGANAFDATSFVTPLNTRTTLNPLLFDRNVHLPPPAPLLETSHELPLESEECLTWRGNNKQPTSVPAALPLLGTHSNGRACDVTLLMDRNLRRQREMADLHLDHDAHISVDVCIPNEFGQDSSSSVPPTSLSLRPLAPGVFSRQSIEMCAACARRSMETPPRNTNTIKPATFALSTNDADAACTCAQGLALSSSLASPTLYHLPSSAALFPLTRNAQRDAPVDTSNSRGRALLWTSNSHCEDVDTTGLPLELAFHEMNNNQDDHDPTNNGNLQPKAFLLRPKIPDFRSKSASPLRSVSRFMLSDTTDFVPHDDDIALFPSSELRRSGLAPRLRRRHPPPYLRRSSLDGSNSIYFQYHRHYRHANRACQVPTESTAKTPWFPITLTPDNASSTTTTTTTPTTTNTTTTLPCRGASFCPRNDVMMD